MKHILVLALAAASVFAQTDSLNVSGTVSASVRRAEKILEEKIKAGLPDDELRRELSAMADRSEHNMVAVVHRRAGAVIAASVTPNLRTNAGTNWAADILGSTSTPSVNAQCNYIGLTDNSDAPSVTDTSLTAEIASNGLSRAQAAYAHTANANSFTLTRVFTASGTQSSRKAGLFTASSGGTMCHVNTYTATTVNNGDTLTITWTVNLGSN